MNVRAFVAIDLSESVRDSLLDLSLVFRDGAPEWAEDKWVAPENLHVTVKFLGTLPDVEVPAASRVLEAAVSSIPPFELGLVRVRAVPNERRATMLWGVFADSDICTRLARAVDEALQPLGIPAEQRRFVPHVTLVRTRRPRKVPEEALGLVSGALAVSRASGVSPFVSVGSLTLYSSTLGPSGPTYEPLARLPLRG